MRGFGSECGSWHYTRLAGIWSAAKGCHQSTMLRASLHAAFAVGTMLLVVVATTAAAAGNIVVPRLEVTDCVARNATPIEGSPTVFWSEAEHFVDGRVRQSAAAHLMRRFGAFKEGGAVVDIGAGRGGLREYLPPTTTYVPVDVMGYEGVRTSV